MSSKRAVILAGGKGRRLRPYTVVLPKPLMPIGEFPILEVVIKQLVKNGFDHISMAVNHQASLIKTFFGNGEKWSIKIDYYEESDPLGTMGPLSNIHDLPENFLVMNGDILTKINLPKLLNFHQNNNADITIAGSEYYYESPYGVVDVDGIKFKSIIEKPTFKHFINAGIYIITTFFYKFFSTIFKNCF